MWEILIVACLSYGIWLVGDAVYRRLRPKKKTLPKKPKRHLSGEQLLGKCRYEVGQKQTNVSTYPKAEQAMDKEHIFAPDKKNESPEPLHYEESNEEFSGLEIPVVSLEYEPETVENDNSNLGEEAEEIIPAADGKVELAVGDGVNWEAWAEALSVISRTDATPDQIAKAGELLHQSEGNDIVDKLRSEPQRSQRVDELICSYFERRSKVRITEENPFADTTGVAGDFDIRNYIN